MKDGAVVRLSRFQQPHLFAADFGNDRIDKFEDGRRGAEGLNEREAMETPFRRLGLAPKAGFGRSERVGAGTLETQDRPFETADAEDGATLVPICGLDRKAVS